MPPQEMYDTHLTPGSSNPLVAWMDVASLDVAGLPVVITFPSFRASDQPLLLPNSTHL